MSLPSWSGSVKSGAWGPGLEHALHRCTVPSSGRAQGAMRLPAVSRRAGFIPTFRAPGARPTRAGHGHLFTNGRSMQITGKVNDARTTATARTSTSRSTSAATTSGTSSRAPRHAPRVRRLLCGSTRRRGYGKLTSSKCTCGANQSPSNQPYFGDEAFRSRGKAPSARRRPARTVGISSGRSGRGSGPDPRRQSRLLVRRSRRPRPAPAARSSSRTRGRRGCRSS